MFDEIWCLLMEYRALLMEHRAFLMKQKALLIEYRGSFDLRQGCDVVDIWLF